MFLQTFVMSALRIVKDSEYIRQRCLNEELNTNSKKASSY